MQNISETENLEYAGFWVRACAYLIDLIVLIIPLLLLRLLLWGITSSFEGTFVTENLLFQYNLTDIILYIAKSTYFIACTYVTGTTVGKKLLNLKVVGCDGEEKLELLNVIYRECVGRFLNGFVCDIGYLIVGLDKEKRGFHDMLCETRVVYAKKIKTYEEKKVVELPKMIESPPGKSYTFVPEEITTENNDNREDFINEDE